jgi:alpha-amylase/alpha-mannosidase (GH57 family)
MSEKETILTEKLDYSGLFKFADFYKYAHSWLDDEDYGVVEDKYAEKISGNSKDIDVEWKCTKKVSDYFKNDIKVKFEIKGLVDVEVEVDGKKKKMQQGKVKVDIKGTLIRDPESKWEGAPYLRFLRDVYNKYVVPQRVDEREESIDEDVKNLKDELKSFLDLTAKR